MIGRSNRNSRSSVTRRCSRGASCASARPRRSSRPPRNSTSIGRVAVGRMHDRRHGAQLQVARIDADRAQRVDSVRVDVERDQTSPAGIDRQVEPWRSRLLGADAHADRGGALQVGLRSIGQLEELVWRDDEVDAAAAVGQRPVVDDDALRRPVCVAASTIHEAMSRMNPLPVAATNTRTSAFDPPSTWPGSSAATKHDADRLARGASQLAQRPSDHACLVGVVTDVAQHSGDQRVPTHRGRQRFSHRPDFGAPVPALRRATSSICCSASWTRRRSSSFSAVRPSI